MLSVDGRERRFSWIMYLRINQWNVMKLMRAGWVRLSACPSGRIENQTFNTLKNQGCEFERNFGHEALAPVPLDTSRLGAKPARARVAMPVQGNRRRSRIQTRLGSWVSPSPSEARAPNNPCR